MCEYSNNTDVYKMDTVQDGSMITNVKKKKKKKLKKTFTGFGI